MSEIDAAPPAAGTDRRHRPGIGRETQAFIGLAALSIVGIAVADFSAANGLWFWLGMVPIFAAFSIATGWARARRRGEGVSAILWTRALHWAPLPLAFYLIYALEETGRLNREDAGLVALIALALTTLLAGVHFDWRLAVLGVLLGATAGAAALIDEFFWVLLIPAVLVAAGAVYWHRRTD